MEQKPKDSGRPQPDHVISAPAAGRLDSTLSSALQAGGITISTRRVRGLCDAGKIRINNQKARSGDRLLPGDRIEIFDSLKTAAPQAELAAGSDLTLAYEDRDLAIVLKPRGMHSVRLRSEDPLTLADLIAARFPEAVSASPDPREAGAVQRLDYYTSGLVIVARRAEVWHSLHQLILQGGLTKRYRALVEGSVLSPQTVSIPMISKDGARAARAAEQGEEGQSLICAAEAAAVSGAECSIVVVESVITKRHQIRFHLSAIGHPLVGDEQYGSKRRLAEIFTAGQLSPAEDSGFLLHAESLEFIHPFGRRTVSLSIESPLLQSLTGAAGR